MPRTRRVSHVPKLWSNSNTADVVQDDSALLEKFTESTRRICFGALCWRANEDDLAKPTPEELYVLDQLGHHVAAIFTELLARWTKETIKLNRKLPFTRAIEVSLDNMQVIDRYAEFFKHEWEDVFGKMDGTDTIWLPLHVEPPFYHNLSTGDAAKTFFSLMLFTRLQVMEKRRRDWGDILGFKEVPLKELPEDVNDCHICQQPLGVPDDDGLMEMPIRVVACCGNYFGANCLRRWYGEFENAKCPLCNWPASSSFLNKLCYEGTEEGIDVDDDLDKGSAIAHMGSVRALTPDINEDLEDGETDIAPYGVGYGGVHDDDNNGLEDGEIKE
jgi:hypothetical protein